MQTSSGSNYKEKKLRQNIGASFFIFEGVKKEIPFWYLLSFLDAVFRDYMDDAFRTDDINQDK